MYVCLRNGGKCSYHGSQPLFFANGVKGKSIYFKEQYQSTDKGNGGKPYIKGV